MQNTFLSLTKMYFTEASKSLLLAATQFVNANASDGDLDVFIALDPDDTTTGDVKDGRDPALGA